MLTRLKILFASVETSQEPGVDQTQIAAAALMVHAAAMDDEFGAEERTTIHRLITSSFALTEAEADELLSLAETAEAEAIDLFRWTQTLKDSLGHEERVALIEKLWEVAYADGILHDYEANLLRRVAGLIYVPDREVGEARQRVLTRLGLDRQT